ncbi:DNA translocase FtsK [Sporosarcina soli]|uniref:DNA translocase FtsK n=1 Tax=Sporosarcina soli TaxID=334736 RepID=A0ABW0TPQ7_9BACL
MSWFKKIMNRFIGPEEDTSTESVEQYDDEQVETVEKFERKQGPSFRFPIISDAEIYGWEDESTTKRASTKNDKDRKDTEDDYETKPLFENERWPGDSRPVNVYRVGDIKKYPISDEKEKEVFPLKADALPKESTAKKKTNPKYFSKTFIPSSVPSPIYGYTRPNNMMSNELKSQESKPAFPDSRERILEETSSVAIKEEQTSIYYDEELSLLTEQMDAKIPDEIETVGIVTEETVHPMDKLAEVPEQLNEIDLMEKVEEVKEKNQPEPSIFEEETVYSTPDFEEASEQSNEIEFQEAVEEKAEEQLAEYPVETPPASEDPLELMKEPLEIPGQMDEADSIEMAEEQLAEYPVETPPASEDPLELMKEPIEVPGQADEADSIEMAEEQLAEYSVETPPASEGPLELVKEPLEVPRQLDEAEFVSMEAVEEQMVEHPLVTSTPPEETEELMDDPTEVSERLEEIESMEMVEDERAEYAMEGPTSLEETFHFQDKPTRILEQLPETDTVDMVDELVEERAIESSISTEEISEPVIEPVVQEPEEKSEKIVPFNVLMLKSDKEKLQASQPSTIHALLERNEREENFFRANKETVEREVIQKETGSSFHAAASEVEETVEEEPYYAMPPMDFLIPPELHIEDSEWLESQSEKLEVALSHFSVQANVIEAVQGPTVTRFELTVGQGTKVSKVRNLTDDLKLALAAEDIRIQAPIPGRSSIGIEIPNRKTRAVRISEVISTEQFSASTSPMEAVLGLSLTGEPVTLDLRKMPHGMIAGATGSGKSVCINSILVSLLYKANPADLKLMLIDPKMVELAPFNGIPHLISPVITDVKAATAALKWAVAEMERRYELLAHAGVRDIERYNKLAMENRQFSLKMPYLLIVIDELADLMMMAPADVEVSISRIAQKARACGIHLIIATQRPSVDVITGTIKANIPTRIAFSVSSQIDSRTIIDTPGAERLLGKGDMLYIGNGQSSAVRLQGTFVTDDEIERIIEHVQNEAAPDYLFGQEELLATSIEEEETDPLFEDACIFVYEQGGASTSLLQRNFSIGYNRAAKLMDRMEKKGFISEQRGSKPRDVFLTESDIEKLTERPDY